MRELYMLDRLIRSEMSISRRLGWNALSDVFNFVLRGSQSLYRTVCNKRNSLCQYDCLISSSRPQFGALIDSTLRFGLALVDLNNSTWLLYLINSLTTII